MPRGRGKNYKGRTRHFTSAEEIDRQMNDDTWRKRKDEDEDSEAESSDEDETPGTVKGIIDVENPNRVQNKLKKVAVLDESSDAPKPELTRREREAIEKEQARQRYEKLHAEGKTDEARADLARLAIIKKQREDAAKKKEQEKKDKDAKLVEAEQARKAAMEAQASAPKPGGRRRKR